ncbi:MAG: hypothetical protein ACI8S6_005837, partial [Myxococcota bacterium]
MVMMTMRAMLTAALAAFLAGCVPHSTGSTEVGIRVNKIGVLESQGVVAQPYPPGATYFFPPVINDWYVYDTALQNLVMTRDHRTGDRTGDDALRFKTVDGNDISVDVTVAWSIDPTKVDYLVQFVGADTQTVRERLVRPVSRTVVRDVLNELPSEKYYDANTRFEKAEQAAAVLNYYLNNEGVIVQQVLLGEHKFNDRYEQIIRDKKVAEQDASRLRSETEAAREQMRGALEVAKGDVSKAIEEARGEAEKREIMADAPGPGHPHRAPEPRRGHRRAGQGDGGLGRPEPGEAGGGRGPEGQDHPLCPHRRDGPPHDGHEPAAPDLRRRAGHPVVTPPPSLTEAARDRLRELLSHSDDAIRTQGAQLLLACEPEDTAAVLSGLTELKKLALPRLCADGVHHPDASFTAVVLTGAQLARWSAPRLEAERLDLDRAHLPDADLRAATLERCRLTAACLDRADLTGSRLIACEMSGLSAAGADFSHARLESCSLAAARLSKVTLRGAILSPLTDLREADLSGAHLAGADLRGTDLRSADLTGADLRSTDLRGARLDGALLDGADLRGALQDLGSVTTESMLEHRDLTGWQAPGRDLSGLDLRGACLHRANLRGARLQQTGLWEADLAGADLRDTDLRGADLRGASLRGADLTGADLRGTLLDGALADADTHEAPAAAAMLAPGAVLPRLELATTSSLASVQLRGAVLGGLSLAGVDLQGADLSGLRLSWGVLVRCSLRGASLSKATVTGLLRLLGVDLRGADLSGLCASKLIVRGCVADARTQWPKGQPLSGVVVLGPGADAAHAELSGLDLRDTDLRGADLRGASLRGADLRGTDLSGVNLDGADLAGAWVDSGGGHP